MKIIYQTVDGLEMEEEVPLHNIEHNSDIYRPIIYRYGEGPREAIAFPSRIYRFDKYRDKIPVYREFVNF